MDITQKDPQILTNAIFYKKWNKFSNSYFEFFFSKTLEIKFVLIVS